MTRTGYWLTWICIAVVGVAALRSSPANAQAIGAWVDAQQCQQLSKSRPEQALVYCNSALKPTSQLSVDETSKTLIARGNALLRAHKNFDQAVADFSTAISMNEYNADAFLARALAYTDHGGDPNRAMDDAQRVLALEPKNTTAYLIRGTLFARKGEAKKAIADADTAGKLMPDFFLVHIQRGIIFTLANEKERAKKAYLKALKLSPSEYAESIRQRIKTLSEGTR